MTNDTKITAIRATIEALINAGTTSDLSGLDQIYHETMKIHMIDINNNFIQQDKPSFIAMLQGMTDSNGTKSNTWAEYHSIEADGDNGHVMITRKVNIGGAGRILVLSIDLLFEDDRWQVTREVIFARPNPDATQA